jgi:hypothetical protein
MRPRRRRVLGCERLGDVDQIGHRSDGLGDIEMIDVNPFERVLGDGRTKQIIRLELADGVPERGQQRRRGVQPSLPERNPAGIPQESVLEAPQGSGRCLLSFATDGHLGPRQSMVPRRTIRADQHSTGYRRTGPTPPQFESTGRGELEVVVMGVDEEQLHRSSTTR